MTTLEHKYAVGQIVYFKSNSYEKLIKECDTCGGTGSLTRKDGKEIQCPTCKGKELIDPRGKKIITIKNSQVEHIEIYVEENSYGIIYFLDSGHEFPEEDLFSTEDEAKMDASTGFKLSPDYETLFTNIPKEDWGVHIYHCCKKHGCKYGDDDNCPVSLGLTKQDHPCEVCKDEESEDLPF